MVERLVLDVAFRETVVPVVDAEAAAHVIRARPPQGQEAARRLLAAAAAADRGRVHRWADPGQARGHLRAIGAALRISDEDSSAGSSSS